MAQHIYRFLHFGLMGGLLAAFFFFDKDLAELSDLVLDLREAVAMVEAGAHQMQEASVALDTFTRQQNCVADQGEWHPEFGCSLQLIQE